MKDTYPAKYRDAKPDSMLDPSTCYNRECVSYCAWKISEATGKWPKRTGGMDAKNWLSRLSENGYKTQVSAPVLGGKYVGVIKAFKHGALSHGHVVWSDDGTTNISEYNWGVGYKHKFRTRSIKANDVDYWVQIVAPKAQKTSSFLPAKGYWGYGDKDARVGKLASFMRKTFPAYTSVLALGNTYGKYLKKSITEFQKRTKLEADGNVGPKTLAALKKQGFKE